MLKNSQLKVKYLNLLATKFSLLEWLTKDTLWGFWVLDNSIDNIWINDAFIKNMGYKIIENKITEYSIPFEINDEAKTKISNFLKDDQKDFTGNLKFTKKTGIEILLLTSGKKVRSSEGENLTILKFKKSSSINSNKNLKKELKVFKGMQAVYNETNELAKVGGWEVDLITGKVIWTKVTKDIHGVEQDYEPILDTAINFFTEGWSRDKITVLFNNAVENGIPYDTELKIQTGNNEEIWVRALGKPEFIDGKCIRVYGAFQDIDNEKKIQLEFERTKEEYERVFKNSAVGNVLVKTSGEMLQANKAALQIFGLEDIKNEDLLNLSFKDLIHPDFLDKSLEYKAKLLSGELNQTQFEAQFYKKNGELIWCHSNSSIIRSDKNGEGLIVTQIEDITLKKQLEFKARENAKRFKTAFDYSPIGMGMVNTTGIWEMVNQNLVSMFGYTKEEFIKKRSSELTHPDDLKKDSKMLKSLFKREINSYKVEKRFIHKNGTTVIGLLNVSTVTDDNGEVLYLIGQISDLTQRILSEKALAKSLGELESLLDATTYVSIIQIDLDGIIIKFNKGAENLLGYNSEEVKGIFEIVNFHKPDELKIREEELTEHYQQNITGFEVFTFRASRGHYDSREWTYVKKDGKEFPVQLITTPIAESDGKITGYLCVATDITQIKKMEASLILAKKKAEAANKSKSEFLANMSHEIRTPLNGIIGFIDLLMRTELEESQQKYMQTIYNSGISLMDIINDVLDFSKIEAGKLELNKERIDLIQLCEQTIDIIKHQAHKKGLEVLLNISPELRRYVYADPVRIRQILTNLLGNAVKFTKKGEIELNITSKTRNDEEDESIFIFSIRDTGIGIAAENLDKIFFAFNQEDASTTRKYGGSGLGLTISNKLLNLMDSKLELKSVLNEGSTFFFKVKLNTDTNEQTYSSITPKNIEKVLIIDDNTNNRIILKEMLAANNIESSECENGIDALSLLLNGEDFDLAIIDYNMPYMNGLSVIDQIRNELNKNAEELPIVLLHSSTEDEEIIKGCEQLNVHHQITKPIQMHTLFAIIDSIGLTSKNENQHNIEPIPSIDITKVVNILVVEDNPVNKFLANSILKKILPNANLLQAENGKEAIDQFKKNKLDLILMDIQMPVMGGFEATREIRKLEKDDANLPIIALTARALKDEKEKSAEQGLTNYLTKPVVLEEMRKMIYEYLNIK